jgi:hypothetical protein
VPDVCGLHVVPAFLSCFCGSGCGPRMLARLGAQPPCAVAAIPVRGGHCVSGLVLSGSASVEAPSGVVVVSVSCSDSASLLPSVSVSSSCELPGLRAHRQVVAVQCLTVLSFPYVYSTRGSAHP